MDHQDVLPTTAMTSAQEQLPILGQMMRRKNPRCRRSSRRIGSDMMIGNESRLHPPPGSGHA